MKNTFLLLTFLVITASSQALASNNKQNAACPKEIDGKSYSDIFTNSKKVAFPKKLFHDRKNQDLIGFLNEKDCHDAVEKSTRKIAGKIYNAYFTVLDQCDGGNTYGLILQGSKVVATIGDSEIYCLERIKKERNESAPPEQSTPEEEGNY